MLKISSMSAFAGKNLIAFFPHPPSCSDKLQYVIPFLPSTPRNPTVLKFCPQDVAKAKLLLLSVKVIRQALTKTLIFLIENSFLLLIFKTNLGLNTVG